MANVDLFNAAVAGMIIGWWMRDIGRAARAIADRIECSVGLRKKGAGE